MSRLLNALVIVCLCLSLLPTSSVTEADLPVEREAKGEERFSRSTLYAPHSTPFVPGQVIVKLRDGATLSREPGKLLRANRSSLDATLTQIGACPGLFHFPQLW